MRTAVIIVTYNAEKYIEDCLRSFFSATYGMDGVEVIVVENASSDATVSIITTRFPQVTLLRMKDNLGFAGGNNAGIRYALDRGAAYVYLLNQDTECESGFLSEAIRVMERDSKIASVQSLLLLHPDKHLVNSWGNAIHFLGLGYAGGYKRLAEQARGMDGKPIAYASGAAVLLRASALREVGLFHPDFFMYHEDLDLGWRFLLSGWKNILSEKSVVYHKYEFSRSIKKYYYMERNRFFTLLTNYNVGTLLLIFPALLWLNVGLLGSSFFSGWWREELRAWAWFFRPVTWRSVRKTRREIQSKRQVKDRDIAPFFVSTIDFQEVMNPIVKYILNPVLIVYWKVVIIIMKLVT